MTTAVRVLKIASCSSLSGQSTLTYHIGCAHESDIYFRVYDNTGGGFFSDEWIALAEIQQVFKNCPLGKLITSFRLFPLFTGRSLNTPGFLLAALKNEGLVLELPGKHRGYEPTDPAEFIAAINALAASSIELETGEKPQQASSSKKKAKPKA